MVLSAFIRKIRNFAKRSWFEKTWLLPCWLLMGLSRLLILVVPFRYLAPYLGAHAGIAPWLPLVGSCNEAKALAIARTIEMTARYTPWEANCFPQALTARILLGLYRIPYVFFFGVDKDDDLFKAHAWVAVGKIPVAGGESFTKFTVVGCFAAPSVAFFI